MTRIAAITRGESHLDLVYRDDMYTIAGQHLLHVDDRFTGKNQYEHRLTIPSGVTRVFGLRVDTHISGFPNAWEAQVQRRARRTPLAGGP